MRFVIFGDSSCNLPKQQQMQFGIEMLDFTYEMEGKLVRCPRYPEEFDGKSYYDYLRSGGMVKTSLLGVGAIMDAFTPFLEMGADILYVTMSAGISGTHNAAVQAARLLKEDYPDRQVRIFDSMGSGLGTGLLIGRASDYRALGRTLDETWDLLVTDCANLCEFFTVDDLMFLKRTGRVSGVTATLGNMLQLKPLLRGDETGHIVAFNKVRGRKKSLEALIDLYRKRVVNPGEQRVYISHGDCLADAQYVAEKIKEIAMPKELILALHEPLTGAHVGPGMMALFFLSDGR